MKRETVKGRDCVNQLGTWNVRAVNGIAKGEEVVHVFRKENVEFLALIKTKLKGGFLVMGEWYHCRYSRD